MHVWTYLSIEDTNKTIITANGKVLRAGEGGMIVVDELNQYILFEIEEVSDDETINVFATTHPDSSGFWHNPEEESENKYELLLSRSIKGEIQ